MNKKQIMDNINGLSKGDRAFCGSFGVVRCTRSASETSNGVRMFAVSGSQKIQNRGNWTMKSLREAIEA